MSYFSGIVVIDDVMVIAYWRLALYQTPTSDSTEEKLYKRVSSSGRLKVTSAADDMFIHLR